MSKKPVAEKVNKSEEIRKALTLHPEKGPKEIAEYLATKGIETTATIVSTIKSKTGGGAGGKKGKGAVGKKEIDAVRDLAKKHFDGDVDALVAVLAEVKKTDLTAAATKWAGIVGAVKGDEKMAEAVLALM